MTPKNAKITAAVVSVLTIGGLLALATPAIASAISSAPATETAAPAESAAPAEPAATELASTSEDEPRDEVNYPGCEELHYPNYPDTGSDPVDMGEREFAAGEVGLVDGIPTTYTVAAGDAIMAIGARFCVFSAGIFYFNEVEKRGAIQPGEVIKLRDAE